MKEFKAEKGREIKIDTSRNLIPISPSKITEKIKMIIFFS